MQQLYTKFNQSIGWNSFLFFIQKLLFLSLSFVLYKHLTTKDFSLWANINSVLYLLLLWVDFGLRKSVPRYAPAFAQNKQAMRSFVRFIMFFQLSIVTIIAPVFFFIAPTLAQSLGLQQHTTELYLGCILFVTEGIMLALRLIYHSYFWNKQFNLVQTSVLIAQLLASVALVGWVDSSHILLLALFFIKITGGIFIIGMSVIMLPGLYKDSSYPGNKMINTKKLGCDCAKHSGIMWVKNNLKSITERNFLVPIFTWALGPEVANLFKVANDGALFFQRIVLKTIGTTDTSLLAHIEMRPDADKVLQCTFKKLTTKIISLSVPLLGLLVILYCSDVVILKSHYALQLFFILASCYLLHAILTPYERVLEVKRNYLDLIIAYLPYLLLIPLLIKAMPFIGLAGSIILIHTVRLVSASVMVWIARKKFVLEFPIRFTSELFLGVSCAVALAVWLLRTYFSLFF